MNNIIKYRAKHFGHVDYNDKCWCGADDANKYLDALEEKLGQLFELVIEDEASSYQLGKVIKEIWELKYEEA